MKELLHSITLCGAIFISWAADFKESFFEQKKQKTEWKAQSLIRKIVTFQKSKFLPTDAK